MAVKIIKSVKEMQSFSSLALKDGKTIGFVPTMGYLHDGHISLLKKANETCDISIVSIFVNPTQFGPSEDFAKYPRDFERDKELLDANRCCIIFAPEAEEIYSKSFQTYVEVNKITKILEGVYRPEHFKGVTTIVAVLFNCVKPDYAFFGQKDAQQAAVIKRMVEDLKIDVKIQICPIIRESDGLAMSSRNIYLSEKERQDALVLSRSLSQGKDMILAGERNSGKIISVISENISKIASARMDYAAIVEEKSFEPAGSLEEGKNYYILIASRIGSTRLIDNILVSI